MLTVNEMVGETEAPGLEEVSKYGLAWIKLWVESYHPVTDDGPIYNTQADPSAKWRIPGF